MKKNGTINLVRCFVILILLLPVSNCGENIKNTYKPLEGTDGKEFTKFSSSNASLIHFSFEYPSSYYLTDESKGNNNPSLVVQLSATTENELGKHSIKYMDIWITNYSSEWLGLPDAKKTMDEHIADVKWALYRNYRLIEKQKVVLEGVEGWETIVTYRSRLVKDNYHGWSDPPAFITERNLFFDYQGMTWEFRLYTDSETYKKQTKEDFEHVLRTFKFPD
jgi:hypothetical protein